MNNDNSHQIFSDYGIKLLKLNKKIIKFLWFILVLVLSFEILCENIYIIIDRFQKSAADLSKLYEMGNEMDRRPFMDKLLAFLEEKGTPITAMPSISKQPLDLYRLYFCVREKGGMVEVRCSVVSLTSSYLKKHL